jgi:dUTP pyrophosphatase
MIKNKVVKFFLLNKSARLPVYDYDDDAAFGIFSSEEKKLKPGEIYPYSTGIVSEIPKNHFVSFRDRSSMGLKGIHVLGGVVDSGYRGEWKVILINLGRKDYKISVGDKIAQGILQEAYQVKIVKFKNISGTERGDRGFGSTGK